jgi:hypothetical protein
MARPRRRASEWTPRVTRGSAIGAPLTHGVRIIRIAVTEEAFESIKVQHRENDRRLERIAVSREAGNVSRRAGLNANHVE